MSICTITPAHWKCFRKRLYIATARVSRQMPQLNTQQGPASRWDLLAAGDLYSELLGDESAVPHLRHGGTSHYF